MHAMWGKWGPLYERSKLTGFSYAGLYRMVIIVIVPQRSGLLSGLPSAQVKIHCKQRSLF